MIKIRFQCKTSTSITATLLGLVVMFVLSVSSCGGEKKEVVFVQFDPEKSYTMKATEVSSLISDSGVTRYRMNAKEWLMFEKAADPYWFFPQGIYLEKFDSLFNAEGSIKADTAYYFSKKALWQLVGNVDVINLNGEHFATSELFWSQKDKKVYSDKYIQITRNSKTIEAIGFKSNEQMTKYQLFNSGAEFDAPADSTQTTDSIPSITNKADTLKAE